MFESEAKSITEAFRAAMGEAGLEEQCGEAEVADVEALFKGVLECAEDELYLQESDRYGSLYRRAAGLAARQRESGVGIERAVRQHILMRDVFLDRGSRRGGAERDFRREKRAIRCFSNLLQATVRVYQEGPEQAMSDRLRDEETGAFNSAYFACRLDEEVNRSERYLHDVTVMLVDVRSAERETEEWPEVMRAVARVLRRNSRASDVLAKIEYNRFAILVPETGGADAAAAAARLKGQVTGYLAGLGERYARVGVEVGMASYPEDAGEGDALLSEAIERLREERGGG